ncbi:MAG: spore coat U domain-containing protein [Deltaproteobacteria bacterium]|nr:spore coat U domain-containing protein [Deltaproteobacteria bacterium]
MKKRLILTFAAIATIIITLIAVAPPSTQALTSTTTMNFSMLVQGTCSVTASAVTIPPYASNQPTNNTTDATISVYCPMGTNYGIDIDGGLHKGLSPNPTYTNTRALADPLNMSHIAYLLNWINPLTQALEGPAGIGADAGTPRIDSGTGATQNFKVRVTVPGNQWGNTGLTYTDSATVTVTY